MKNLTPLFILFIALLFSFNARSQYTWSNQHTGSWDLHSVYFVNNFYGYAGGAGGTLFRTLDAGNSGWNSIAGPTSNLIVGLYFTDVTYGFVVDDQSNIFRTTNSGTDWTQVYTAQGGDTAYGITESGGRLFVPRVNEILMSADNGNTWTPISVSSTGSILDISFSDANNGWACGVSGGLMWTDDAGDSWTSLIGPGIYSSNDFNAIHAFGPNDFICVGEMGTIFSTDDGGLSWGFPSAPGAGNLNDISFSNGSHGVVVGDANKVFYTTNGGLGTWISSPAITSSQDFNAVHATTEVIAYMVGGAEEIWRSPTGIDDIEALQYTGPDTVCAGQPFDFSFEFTNVGDWPSLNTGFTVNVFGGGSLFGDTISWSGTLNPGDTASHTEPNAVLNTPGAQLVTFLALETNNNNPGNSGLLINIMVMAPDSTSVTGGTNFCPGDTVTLEAYGGDSYNWLNTTGSNPGSPIQVEYPTVDVSYIVQIQQQYCLITDSAMVLLDPGCFVDTTDTSMVIIDVLESYAFSPNNDGVNDNLVLDFLDGLVTPNNVQIYNRWGDIIYQTDNYDNDQLVWDGTYGERTAPIGTYYFIAEVENEGTVTGWVQLVR